MVWRKLGDAGQDSKSEGDGNMYENVLQPSSSSKTQGHEFPESGIGIPFSMSSPPSKERVREERPHSSYHSPSGHASPQKYEQNTGSPHSMAMPSGFGEQMHKASEVVHNLSSGSDGKGVHPHQRSQGHPRSQDPKQHGTLYDGQILQQRQEISVTIPEPGTSHTVHAHAVPSPKQYRSPPPPPPPTQLHERPLLPVYYPHSSNVQQSPMHPQDRRPPPPIPNKKPQNQPGVQGHLRSHPQSGQQRSQGHTEYQSKQRSQSQPDYQGQQRSQGHHRPQFQQGTHHGYPDNNNPRHRYQDDMQDLQQRPHTRRRPMESRDRIPSVPQYRSRSQERELDRDYGFHKQDSRESLSSSREGHNMMGNQREGSVGRNEIVTMGNQREGSVGRNEIVTMGNQREGNVGRNEIVTMREKSGSITPSSNRNSRELLEPPRDVHSAGPGYAHESMEHSQMNPNQRDRRGGRADPRDRDRATPIHRRPPQMHHGQDTMF